MAAICGPRRSPSMGSVLIVEDDFLIALEISQFVEDAGYTVVGPEKSVDASIRALTQHKIDLALLDVHLGGELVFPIVKDFGRQGHSLHLPHKLFGGRDTCPTSAPAIGEQALFSRASAGADAAVSRLAGRMHWLQEQSNSVCRAWSIRRG